MLKRLFKKDKKDLKTSTHLKDTTPTCQYRNVDFQEMQREIHQNAIRKGFWKDYASVLLMESILKEEAYLSQYYNCLGQRLMLITTEVGEAEEALRHENMDLFREEIADIVIRCMDLAGGMNFDLFDEIQKKHKINISRPYKHGKKF